MNKYYSGYIITNYKENKIGKGKYFNLYLDNPQDINKNFGMWDIEKDILGNIIEIIKKGKEVIIETNNLDNAIKTSELINASLVLINALDNERPKIYPFSENKGEDKLEIFDFKAPSGPEGYSDLNIYTACKIACKASFRKNYTYALTKYKLGSSLFSIPFIDLEPTHSEHIPLLKYESDHTRLAYAIIIFYSIIEELGLEIRASAKNPSFIKGEWNPTVKEDLEKRLKKSKINLSETYDWSLRSKPTKLEQCLIKENRLKKEKKSSWSRGQIRDIEIDITNAISLASYLRSRVSSHKFRNFIKSISVYDVVNVTYLSRRLLLETLGFWKI